MSTTAALSGRLHSTTLFPIHRLIPISLLLHDVSWVFVVRIENHYFQSLWLLYVSPASLDRPVPMHLWEGLPRQRPYMDCIIPKGVCIKLGKDVLRRREPVDGRQ